MAWNVSDDLTVLGIIHKDYSKGYICQCPFAQWTHQKGTDNNKSLVIWPEIDRFQCYACGQKGNYRQFLSEYARLSGDKEAARLLKLWSEDTYRLQLKLRQVGNRKQRTRKEYFDEDILLTFPTAVGTDAEEFLVRRGLRESLEPFDLRSDRINRMVVCPSRDKKGLLGLIGRSVDENSTIKHKKYFCNPSTFLGGESLWTENPKLIVLEGYTDMLRIYPMARDAGQDVCCTWTANISQQQIDLIAQSGKIPYCYFDQDAAGDKGAEEFGKLYPSKLLYRVGWSYKNSKGQLKDTGEFTKEEFRETL